MSLYYYCCSKSLDFLTYFNKISQKKPVSNPSEPTDRMESTPDFLHFEFLSTLICLIGDTLIFSLLFLKSTVVKKNFRKFGIL